MRGKEKWTSESVIHHDRKIFSSLQGYLSNRYTERLKVNNKVTESLYRGKEKEEITYSQYIEAKIEERVIFPPSGLPFILFKASILI